MARRIRYCQRKDCGIAQHLVDLDEPRPCRGCGGVNFDLQPPLHTTRRGYELTDWDRDFLRCQCINPESD